MSGSRGWLCRPCWGTFIQPPATRAARHRVIYCPDRGRWKADGASRQPLYDLYKSKGISILTLPSAASELYFSPYFLPALKLFRTAVCHMLGFLGQSGCLLYVEQGLSGDGAQLSPPFWRTQRLPAGGVGPGSHGETCSGPAGRWKPLCQIIRASGDL